IRDPSNNNRVIVAWSRNNSGGNAYPVGSQYTKLSDDAIVDKDASVIVAELDYVYSSGLTHQILHAPYTFKRIVSRWPRQSDKVVLCGASPLPKCET
ncbi:MAG: hypothetical protein AB7P23_13970, partial [Amphiplicatus sp.]